jgi:hypothetical protein
MLRPSRDLEVQPVRAYPPPRYPTASEPVELDLSDTRTWPFSTALGRAIAAAASALSAVGASGCAGEVVEATPEHAASGPERAPGAATPPGDNRPSSVPPSLAPARPSTSIDRGAVSISRLPGFAPNAPPPRVGVPHEGVHLPRWVENPFTFDKSHLPPDGQVWGKGTPGILPEEVAVAAIRKAFASRAVALQSNVAYAADGVAVQLDGLRSTGNGNAPAVGFEYVTTWWTAASQGKPSNGTLDDYQEPDSWATNPDGGKPEPVIKTDDTKTLNVLEMKKLDADAAAGTRFVAVINSLDPRFVYVPTSGPGGGLPPEFWTSTGVANQSEADAVGALVKAVHGFIDFLAAQGAI